MTKTMFLLDRDKICFEYLLEIFENFEKICEVDLVSFISKPGYIFFGI